MTETYHVKNLSKQDVDNIQKLVELTGIKNATKVTSLALGLAVKALESEGNIPAGELVPAARKFCRSVITESFQRNTFQPLMFDIQAESEEAPLFIVIASEEKELTMKYADKLRDFINSFAGFLLDIREEIVLIDMEDS